MQHMNQVYRAIGDGVALALSAVGLLQHGDGGKALDMLIETQLAAEARFRRNAYAAWSGFPDHPAAPTLAAFRCYLRGDAISPFAFRGLVWLGELIEMHRADFVGREQQVAQRLLSAQNFLPCVFELETSFILRGLRHSTTWLWPRSPERGDVSADEEVTVECILAAQATDSQVPRRLGADLSGALLTAMGKTGRNLAVEIKVARSLLKGDLPLLRDTIVGAIRAGLAGSVALPIGGYEVFMTELAPLDLLLDQAGGEAILARYASFAHKWGGIAKSPLGQPVNPRVVVINPAEAPSAIAAAARAAAQKHAQLKAGQSSLVAVKFGQPVPRVQAINPAIRRAIHDTVADTLQAVKAHRVSTVMWVFEVGVTFPAAGRGLIDVSDDPPGPHFTTLAIDNPIASSPLPAGFNLG